MHLQREFLGWENKFDEDRKGRIARDPAAAPLHWHFHPCLAQLFFSEWAGRDAAVHTREPCFAQRFRQIGFFWEDWRERARSPQSRAEHWLDSKRLRPHGL